MPRTPSTVEDTSSTHAEKVVESHGGQIGYISFYGQDKAGMVRTCLGPTERRGRSSGSAGSVGVNRTGRKPAKQLNTQTWAIARFKRLNQEPEGEDAENIKLSVCFWFLRRNNTFNSANLSRLFAGATKLSLVA